MIPSHLILGSFVSEHDTYKQVSSKHVQPNRTIDRYCSNGGFFFDEKPAAKGRWQLTKVATIPAPIFLPGFFKEWYDNQTSFIVWDNGTAKKLSQEATFAPATRLILTVFLRIELHPQIMLGKKRSVMQFERKISIFFLGVYKAGKHVKF